MSEHDPLATAYRSNYAVGRKQTIHRLDYPYRFLKHYVDQYPKNSRLLDAGCGNGRYARKLFEDGFRNICAFDLYEVNLDQIPTKVGSVCSIPYEDEVFDIAYCLSVLYYEEDVERAFRELGRVLKTNGILLFSVFVSSSPSSWYRSLLRGIGWENRYQLGRMHFRSIRDYRRALGDSGFSVIDINGYFFPKYAQLLNYLYHKGINTDIAPSFKLTRNSTFARFKGMFGYHCLIAATKK